ncbi:hypothetical protein ACQ856_17765 [Mycolicibacterium psychrotolerans]|uniref:hypothetical protein n=1 Tax=Mycolicibacterium psychrotolerans TaxID=216929 RepID=UPI003D667BBF
MYVSNVALVAASSSSAVASETSTAQLLKPFLQVADWVGNWVLLGVYIASAPVYLPLIEFFHSLAPSLMPDYLSTVRWMLEQALVNPFTIDPYARTSSAVSAAITAPVAAAQQADANDVAVSMTPSTPTSSQVNALPALPDPIDRALRRGLAIILLPVTFPITLLGLLQGLGCLEGSLACSDPNSLYSISKRLFRFFNPPLASATASGPLASVVVTHEVATALDPSSASTPGASAAPRPARPAASASARGATHQAAPSAKTADQVKAQKAGAKHADEKPSTAGKSGQGRSARGAR